MSNPTVTPDTEASPAPQPAPDPALVRAQRMLAAQRALHELNAIDLDAGCALLEESIASADGFDAPAAAAALKSRKPALFRAPVAPAGRGAPSATMSPAAGPADPRHELVQAAERAAMVGDRTAVLTYMRLKRTFA